MAQLATQLLRLAVCQGAQRSGANCFRSNERLDSTTGARQGLNHADSSGQRARRLMGSACGGRKQNTSALSRHPIFILPT